MHGFTPSEVAALGSIMNEIARQMPFVPESWRPHLIRCHQHFAESLEQPRLLPVPRPQDHRPRSAPEPSARS